MVIENKRSNRDRSKTKHQSDCTYRRAEKEEEEEEEEGRRRRAWHPEGTSGSGCSYRRASSASVETLF
jgi:hypothetical protein